MKQILFLVFLSIYALAGTCEYNGINETKKESYDIFLEAKKLYSDDQFSKAYSRLAASYNVYGSEIKQLEMTQDCIQITPGPFGAKRTPYKEKEVVDFDRFTLGKEISKNVPPRPLLIVQYIDTNKDLIQNGETNKPLEAKLTAVNVLKTVENKSQGYQTPLTNFDVKLSDTKLTFNEIQSDAQKTKTLPKKIYFKKQTISSSEKYGFNTANF